VSFGELYRIYIQNKLPNLLGQKNLKRKSCSLTGNKLTNSPVRQKCSLLMRFHPLLFVKIFGE